MTKKVVIVGADPLNSKVEKALVELAEAQKNVEIVIVSPEEIHKQELIDKNIQENVEPVIISLEETHEQELTDQINTRYIYRPTVLPMPDRPLSGQEKRRERRRKERKNLKK